MNKAHLIRKALADFTLSPAGHALASVMLAHEGALHGMPAKISFNKLWQALQLKERMWEDGEASEFLVSSLRELIEAKARLTRQNGQAFYYGLLDRFDLDSRTLNVEYVVSRGIARDLTFRLQQAERLPPF